MSAIENPSLDSIVVNGIEYFRATPRQPVDSGCLLITSEERQQIQVLWSRSFKTGKELVQQLESTISCLVGPITVKLSPDLLKRLEGRRGRRELKEFLTETVTQQLEHFVGLR